MRPQILPTLDELQRVEQVVPGINGGSTPTSLPTADVLNKKNTASIPTNPYQENIAGTASELDPEKYPFALKANADNTKMRALYQSGLDQFGNFLMQSTLGEIVGGTVSGLGATLELPIAIMDELTGGDADFSNGLTKLGDAITEYTKDEFPIFPINPGETFDLKDSGWWFSNAVSVASTLSLMIPAWGTAKGLGAIGDLMGMTKNLTQGARALGKQATMAVAMRNAENFKESLHTVENIYNEAYGKFSNMTDEDFEAFKRNSNDPEYADKSRTELANHIAAKSGWNNYAWDAANVIFDFFQLSGAFKAAKALTTAKSTARVLEAQAASMGKELSKAKAIYTNVKNAGLVIGGIGSEGVEEAVNAMASNEGMYYGQNLIGKKGEEGYWDKFGERISEYAKDPATWEQAFWGVVGGGAFTGATKGYAKAQEMKYDYQDPYSDQARIAQINARKVQSELLGKELKDITDGFVPNTNRQGQFRGTKEEIEQQKEDALMKSINRNIETMAISGMQHGNQKLTKEFINSDHFKTFLKTNGLAEEETYQKIKGEINNTYDTTVEKYNYYIHNVFGTLKTNEAVKRIMAGRAVGWDRFERQARKKNENLDKKIVELRKNDLAVNSPEYQKHSVYFADLMKYETNRQAIEILEKEYKEFSDKRSGKIAQSKAKEKIDQLTKERDELAERIKEYTKQNPEADSVTAPASWSKIADLETEKLLNGLAIDQVVSIQTEDLKNAEAEGKEIEEELKKAHEEKKDKDFGAYRNLIDNTSDVLELQKFQTSLDNNSWDIPGRKQTDLNTKSVKKIREYLERKIKGLEELEKIKEQQRQANKAHGQQKTGVSGAEDLTFTAFPKAPTNIDISQEEDYIEAMDWQQEYPRVILEDAETLQQWLTMLEETYNTLDFLGGTALSDTEVEARDFLEKTLEKFINDIKAQIQIKQGQPDAVNDGNVSTNNSGANPSKTAVLNSTISSFLNNIGGLKAIDFQARASVTLDLFKQFTEAFGINEGEELSFERILVYIYEQPNLGRFALHSGYNELLQAYLYAATLTYNGGKLFTQPVNEDVNLITPEYIEKKYSGSGETDNTDNNTQNKEPIDNGVQIYLHPLFQLHEDSQGLDQVSPSKQISESVTAIEQLNIGDKVTMKIDKENERYEANKGNVDKIPIKIVNSSGTLLGYLNEVESEGNVFNTVHGGVIYSITRGTEEYSSMIDYILQNFDSFEELYGDLQQIRSKEPKFKDYNKMISFIEEAINVNRTEDNKIKPDTEQFTQALNHFLNVGLFNTSTNGTTKFNEVEIKKSLFRWHEIIYRDMLNTIKLRKEINANEEAELEQEVLSKSTGSISFAFDANNRPVYRNLNEVVKQEDIVLGHTGNLPGFNIFSIDGTPASQAGYLTDNRQTLYNGLYMLVPSPKRTLVDGVQKTLYIPVKGMLNTIGGDNYDLSDEQQQFNNDLADYIALKIDEIFTDLVNGVKDFTEIEKELRKYIIVDKKHFKIYATQNSKEISFVMFDENNKPIDVKIIQREKSRTIKIGKESTNSRNDSEEEYNTELARAIRGLKRNVNLSKTEGASQKRGLAYQEFTDFTGKEWKSYKDFLIETGAIITNMTKVVDHTGNKTLSYTNPRGVRPQSIVVGAVIDKQKRNKYPISFTSTGKVLDFAKANGLDQRYNFAYELADALGTTINTGVQSDPISIADLRNNKITFYEKYTSINRLEQSTILAHEIIHGLLENTIDEAKYEPFFNDIKTFYNSIRDKALASKDKTVVDIIKYIDGLLKTNENTALEEVITYGLTNQNFARFLQSIEVENKAGKITFTKSAWSEFKRVILDIIQAVAKELGIVTKLDELNYILDSYSNIVNNTNNTPDANPNPQPKDKPDPFGGRKSDDNANPFDEGKLAVITSSNGYSNTVNYVLTAVDLLSSDKGINIFNKRDKNGWTLEKTLTELQVPKEQKQLILTLGITDREEIILDLVSKYTYTVEVNTAKTETYLDVDKPSGIKENTQYYSNVTVSGGTNYTENEIATPLITPSIISHAQFATDKGIGWFRSDEEIGNKTEYSNTFKKDLTKPLDFDNIDDNNIVLRKGSKTRRILEVQSDLFQKGRDENQLTGSKEVIAPSLTTISKEEYSNASKLGTHLEYESIKYNGFLYFAEAGKDEETGELVSTYFKRSAETKNINIDEQGNQFLQLLNKDNNWVTFFVKSIIQDSAKKGYEKVLFPSGDTASKVEGHQTLEEFKRVKEIRLKELEREINNVDTGKSIKNHPFIPQIHQELEREEKGWRVYSNNVPEQLYTIEQIKEPYNREINQIKQELELAERDFGSLRKIWNFYEKDIANILDKRGYSPKLITDEYGNTWNEVEINQARDTGVAKLATITSSQANVNEAKDQIIQALIRTGGLNKNKYNNKYWVRKYKVGDYLEDKQNSLKENKEKVLKKIDQINTFAGSAVVGLNSTDAGATIFFNEYNLQTYANSYKKVLYELKNVPVGYTRLYRGEIFQADLFNTSPLFSRSLEEAVNYNKKYGGNTGKVSYVDVPKDRVDLFRYFDKTTPELEKYYLPTQILSKTKTVVIKINEEENNRKLATITSSYSKDLYVAEGFTAEDELHAYRDLLVTKFLRASMNGQIAATTLKEIREDRSKSVKFLIGDSILKQAKDDYANDLITLEQAQFINKVLDDLNKPTSLLWAKAKDYINNNYGIQIVGEEDFLIDDFTIEIPATWDDRVQFKIPSDETINHLVKSLIYTTPVVDGDKTQVLPNGELVYEVNKSTPSGYAKMLEFDAVYPYLREHMSGLMTKHDMLNKIFELGTLHDKSLFVIWNELNKNENLANAWYSSFNFQIPERHVILLDSQDGVNNIKTDIGNRTAFRQYALSNEWIGNIKLNIETAVYKEEKLWAEYMDLKQKLEDATQRFYTYEDDIYDILSKLFNMFGVDLTPKEMRYFVDNPENQAGYIDDTSMKRVNPKVEIINKYFLQRINYLSEYAIGNNTDNAFGEYSRMLELANMTLKFRYFKGNMSSINVANNLVHAPIKPNFLSEWFKTKDNANTHPDFEELLRQHAGTRKMQFSNWLWNNWSAYTKDTKNIDNPIGFLEILRDKDGTREIVGINSKFARAFKYRLDEGRKNLVTDEGQEYTTITDNLSKLITYLGERKDNMTMYELFNSDSGHTYYMSGVLFPLRYAEYEGKVTRDSVVYKAMRNTVYQEVANLIENFNLVFEREEDEEGLIQYVYDANGLPKVKEEVKHELVLNKHINKKGEVFDANDKLVGRAFTFTGASFNRKIGNSIENVNLGTYLEKVKNRKVFDKNGMLIPGVLASYAEDINDFVDEFIEDLIEKNYELNLQHEEYLTEAAINGGTALGSYRDFRHFISEYALNSYINNVEQKNFFGANTDEIANSLDFSKRANQITKTKQSYDYSGTPSRPYGKYRTLTVSSVFTKGTIYESLMKEFNDAKAAKPFKSINTTDGFSVITLDEFEERAKRNGTYEDNKALIEYLRNPDPTVDKDTLRKLQSLKHFYYGYEYNPILNQFVSVQVKNSEAILVPQFIKGTDMEQLYNFMVRNNVQQLDFNDSIKMGDTPYGYRNFDKLIDKNGNLDFSNGEIAAEVSNDLIKSIKERSYKNLGVQQTVVDHIEDETIKMGVQISKMITNNLQLDKNYNVGGNKIKGKDLITHYDNLWTTKIERQFTQLMVELDIKDVPSIQEITKLIGKNIELQIENAQRTGEWDTISVNPATIISTIVESIAEKVNEKKVYEILLSELKKRTTNINSVLGATINEETNTTFMPVYWSSANKQNMNILASLFTNNVGVLKLPGIHATLASGVFYSNKNAITKKNEQGNYVFKEGEITYINKVAERPDKDLRYTILNNGKVIKAEVLLPAWSKKFFQEGQLVNINELPEEIRTMIGYRIPTEGKRSMFVFEVVGFLPDRLGSTIIVPNDFIKVSGADFDIDSLYIIRRHFNTYRVKDDKTYDSQEFVDFAKKFLMSYAPMWAGEYIKFDRKKVIKKYLDGLLGNAEKVALLDRVNKARYTVKADDVSPETASLLDQIEKDYSIESEYVYDAETGDYIPDQSQKLLPPKTEETETLSDIDYTDFIDLSIIKAALTAYNVEFKKKNKALTYYENIASPSEYATDVTLYDSLLKDSLNSKEGKTIVERGLKNFKEKNLSEMANFLLESLGYKSRVNPDLSSEDYAELITTLLEAKEVDSITELLTKNNFKPMIDLLVKSGLIPSFEEFVKLSDEKKWTNKQIDNGIFDVYQGILNSPLHYREQTNALDAQFPDVQEARNMLEGLTGVKLHKLNVNRPEDIEKLKQINLSVRELKGISAGLDGFYSIAQRTNMRLAVDIAPIIMYEDVTPEKFEYLNKTYKEDILDYDSANQTVTIRHRYIFNNPAGTYLNYDGRFIDSVSSQATSNILDAVKFFLPANVNDYTISLWKALVAVGVGNGWKYPTSFINQPVIVEIIRLHEITNNITYNGTLKDKEIEHIKRKYQDELFELIKTEFEASNAKGVSANRLAKVLQDYSTTKKNSASGLVNIKRVDTEMLLGYNPDKPVPMSLEMLNKMIEASTSEKAASVKARQALLIGQLQVLETYVKLRKVAESLTDGVTTFNTDKTTANDAVTINLIDKIIKIDNYENEGSRLFIGATSAARAIYPLFFGDTESASAYPPLQHYFYYSHLMAQGVMGQFDIRKTGKFMEFLYNFDPKVRDRVANYVLATSVKDLDFFNNTSKMRVLGIETPLNTKLIIDFNKNIDKFNELSFANKTELLKKKFANNKKYKGYTFTLFDYLAPKITHEAVEKKDYQAVDYIYDGKNLNPFILEIAEMYYSGEPYLRSFAEDLIRYSYYTDGFTYGFKTLSKIIPISVLYKDTEQGGIGYNKLLLERANLIKSPGADGILTPEKMKSVYRANWKNSRIVPIARNRKRFNRVREGSAQAKIGIKSGWTNNSWFPDYTADKKGIIAIPYNKFLNESQRIQTSPFIRVKKDAQPIIFRSDSTSLEKIAKEQKTQITTIKDKNEYKIGDILNISNQGLNIHKGKVYKFTNGNWYSIAYLDNGFTKNTQITDKQLLTELNTEFEQPTKFIAVEVTSVREEGGAEYFERVSLMHEIELEAHIAAEGYKGDRIGFLRYLKAIGVKEGEKTAQIITFKKKGEISNRMKKGVGSDMIYEKYVSEKSGTLDTIYFFPVNKLLPYEDSEYSVIDDYNVEFSREEYMNYILSKESLQAKKDNPIQDRVEEEMTILDEYTLKNIKTLPNESVFDINGHVLIQSPITKYDTVSRKALKQQSIEQVDAVINFVINPNEPFNNVIRNLAGDKYIEIVMGSGVDYLPIVEKLNELKANNLFITGQSQNTLRGQLGLQEYKTRMYVTDVLKAIAVHKNIKQRLDGVLTNGNTGIEESANHAAEEIGASSVIRMNSNFVADGMGNPISGNNSLDRFTSERKLATITSNPTEEFEDLPDFLDNGGEPYFNIKSAAERLKNLAQFTVDNYNNFKTRTKYIHNDKTLNQVVEELNDLDFDDIYHNFDTYQLKDALVSTYRYYVITQVSIGNMMRMYDTEIDFEELLDTQERKTEFANRMRYANAFIQGFSSVRNIEYLSKGFDVLDTQIEKLKELEPSISSLKSMYDRIMKRYYEFELLKYSTNPEIKAGLKELFDPQRDMNWGELYLDSLGDTENSFLSNLFKKYATTMIISNDEYKRELRDFNKEYAKFAGNDPKEQVIKRFIDKYISKDKDGNPTGYLISKIDLVAWKEAYKKYMEEVDQVQKKTRSRSKVNDVHAKWIKILYNQTSLDEEGRTPDEAMAVMKAKLSGKLYVKWYKENIDYDSKKAKYYFRSEKSDTFIDPKYTAIKDDPFYQYLSKTVAHYMSFYHTNDFNRTLKKGALPAMMQGEDESWWDKAKSRMGWFDRKNKSFLGENDEIMRTIPINFVNAMVTEKPFVPALPKRPRESYLSWQVRRVEQAEEITGKKFKDEHEVKKYNEEVRAENDKHHGMAISYDIENIMTAFLKNIINYKNKRSIESEMLLGKELLKTLPVLKKGKGGKPTLNPLKTKILNKPVYAVMPGEQSDLLKRYEKFLEMVLYEDFELDEGTWQKLARVLQNYTSMTGMWVNFTGAVNNVAIGKAQSAMEGFSGYFWNRKDANKAEADFWGSVATNIAEIGSETTDNFNVALMKKFSVAQYDDGTADPAENRKNFVHKHLLTTNAMYVMHHMGEYYMQNVNFLSMLHSHRVIDGKIFSLVEYKNDLREKALLEVLTDKQKAEYAEYMDTIKDDRLKNPDKYGVDHIRPFAKNLDKDTLKKYRDKLGQFEEKAKKEFEAHPTLKDSYELKEGVAELKDTSKVDKIEEAKFINKALHVIQKIHGIYNTMDAGMIQNKALGRLAIQFRKWMRPGWNKRFGSKFGKEFWNEQRNEKDKGSYVSFWNFFTEPITDSFKAEMKEEHFNVLRATQRIISDYMRFLANVRLHYGTLDDFEKGNVKRALGEMMMIIGAILIGNLLTKLRGDDDDDDLYVINLAMYIEDRFKTDLQAFVPISPSGGWFNESKKLLRSPFAGFSTLEDLTKLLMYATAYPFQDEEERIYQNGLYSGMSKVGVAFKRSVPIAKQVVKLKRIEDYVEYYKLWSPY